MFFRCARQHTRLKMARLHWLGRSLWLGAALLVIPWSFAKEPMDRDVRIDLIRGLLKEVAVSKVPMPRGKKGLRVDTQGKLDQREAESEIRANGLAIRPGMPVEITKIAFKPDELVFELNGGGKSGKKWYQHIEIGMGTQTSPIGSQQPPTLAYGSSITVSLGKPAPDLTVPQVKKILSGVLDFNRHSPTVLYSPTVPPKVKEAIKKHEVLVGMDRDAVLSAKGTPDRRVREVRDGVEQEDWLYGLPPHVLFVTFDGDQVVSVRQF
jgi:hypothetical protein